MLSTLVALAVVAVVVALLLLPAALLVWMLRSLAVPAALPLQARKRLRQAKPLPARA